jgi:hypothetical protein
MRHRIERLINWLHHPKGRHRRTPARPTHPVSAPQAPRRLRTAVNGDSAAAAAAAMVRPCIVVAEARRNGAVSW